MNVASHPPTPVARVPGESDGDPLLAEEPRAVDADRGVAWLVQGWHLFRRAPLVWIAISVMVAIGVLVIAWIPIVGQLATTLLTIQLAGGLMLGCRALDRGEALDIGGIAEGIKRHFSALLVVGALYVAGLFALIVTVSLVTGGAVLAVLKGGAEAGGAVASVLLALLASAVILVPLAMATWFAPALVTLNGLAPVEAMKASCRGCLRNLLPFLVYGVLCMVLALLATVPAGLGWFVFLPVLAASVYAGYRDVFFEPRGMSPSDRGTPG